MTLIREVADTAFDSHPEKACFVGTVYLNESLNNLDDLNIFCVRQQIPLQDCDILISVTSKNVTGTITTPAFVNKVLKHIDCQITFSFEVIKEIV